MIYPIQIKAARSLLGLSQGELARRANLSVVTVKRLEAAGIEIRGSAQTTARVQKALESCGIVFIEQDRDQGPGGGQAVDLHWLRLATYDDGLCADHEEHDGGHYAATDQSGTANVMGLNVLTQEQSGSNLQSRAADGVYCH